MRRSSGAGLEYTAFAAAFLPEVLDEVFRLYALLLTRPRLPEEGLEAVRSVALQALLSLEDQPARKLLSELRRKVFRSPTGASPWAGRRASRGRGPRP